MRRIRSSGGILKCVALGGAAALATTVLSTSPVDAATVRHATATASPGSRLVVARMSSTHVKFSVGSSLRAGRVTFRVVSPKGDHELQLLRLHPGYSLQQAGADFGKAFNGDVAAVRRLDAGITFRGGAEAKPHHNGLFTVSLKAGDYLAVDQDSNAMAPLHVFGTPRNAARPRTRGSVTAYSYGFGGSVRLPHDGWIRFFNQSDQPHFIVLNHVKRGTTATMVRKYFASGGQGRPAFGLRAETSMAVVSPNRSEFFHIHLPRGKYLMACYWPDDDTGMPHALMGMWRLVTVR
jgi:hypothetical protein